MLQALKMRSFCCGAGSGRGPGGRVTVLVGKASAVVQLKKATLRVSMLGKKVPKGGDRE